MKAQEKLAAKVGSGNLNELMGYHGTRATHPDVILHSPENFDVNWASPGGAYNKGLYFARHCDYSLRNYAFYEPDSTKSVFLARVLTGKRFDPQIWRDERDRFYRAQDELHRVARRQDLEYGGQLAVFDFNQPKGSPSVKRPAVPGSCPIPQPFSEYAAEDEGQITWGYEVFSGDANYASRASGAQGPDYVEYDAATVKLLEKFYQEVSKLLEKGKILSTHKTTLPKTTSFTYDIVFTKAGSQGNSALVTSSSYQQINTETKKARRIFRIADASSQAPSSPGSSPMPAPLPAPTATWCTLIKPTDPNFQQDMKTSGNGIQYQHVAPAMSAELETLFQS